MQNKEQDQEQEEQEEHENVRKATPQKNVALALEACGAGLDVLMCMLPQA